MHPAENIDIKRERAVAFVVARLSSSRLPGKQFMQIGAQSILSWIIGNLRNCKELDEIVITTVAEEANEPLRAFADQESLPCFWYQGEINHVTTRLRLAAEEYEAEICLLISADCPLVYGPAVDQLIRQMRAQPEMDHLSILPDAAGQSSALEGVQVARKSAWQLADTLADQPELKEHQFPLIWMRPELFKRLDCRLTEDLYAPAHRFSVDTRADLEFMNSLHDRLLVQDRPFSLPEVLCLMQQEPELASINRHVHQRRLVEPDHRALFVVDTGDTFGFGHLMRSLELADQLTERKGWPVTFLIDDTKAAELLTERGYSFKWGAFAREVSSSPEHLCHALQKLLPEYNLLVLDIFDQRGPNPGWRGKLDAQLPIAVVDNRLPWAAEADLLITPGVTASQDDPALQTAIEHLSGTDHLILRRDIRREGEKKQQKNLDLLVYLHDQQQVEAVNAFVTRHAIRAEILSDFTPALPALMAGSHYYLSGFGISFYEALTLGTMPICWPDSFEHQRDALTFYQNLALPPYLLTAINDLDKYLLPWLKSELPALPSLTDGTPRLVEALATLVSNYHCQDLAANR